MTRVFKQLTDRVSHGRRGTYINYGCRCVECTAANAQYQTRADTERAERLARGEVQIVHGTANAYTNYRCRCTTCVAGNSARCRDYKARTGYKPPREPKNPVRPAGAITPGRTGVLLALLRVFERDGRATVQSVVDEAGLSSVGGTYRHHLVPLRDAGLVDWEPNRAGTLRPLVGPVPFGNEKETTCG